MKLLIAIDEQKRTRTHATTDDNAPLCEKYVVENQLTVDYGTAHEVIDGEKPNCRYCLLLLRLGQSD